MNEQAGSPNWVRVPPSEMCSDGIRTRFSCDTVTEYVIRDGKVVESRDVTAEYRRDEHDDGRIQWQPKAKAPNSRYGGFGVKADAMPAVMLRQWEA